MPTDTDTFADDLLDLLGDHICDELNYGSSPIRNVQSYQNAGLLTYNDGLLVTLEDGSQYQITIVRSR